MLNLSVPVSKRCSKIFGNNASAKQLADFHPILNVDSGRDDNRLRRYRMGKVTAIAKSMHGKQTFLHGDFLGSVVGCLHVS